MRPTCTVDIQQELVFQQRFVFSTTPHNCLDSDYDTETVDSCQEKRKTSKTRNLLSLPF